MAPARILVVEDENSPAHELQERLRGLGFRVTAYSEKEWNASAEAAIRRQALQAKVEPGQDWFFTTLRNIGDAVVVSDEENRVTLLNPAAESLIGWVQSEAYGRPLAEVLRLEPPTSKAEGGADADRPSAGSDSVEAELIGRGGWRAPVETKSALIRDDSGKTIGTVRILRDLSERERAEAAFRRSERRYHDLVEASRDILFTLSAEGLLTSLNPAFEKATGKAVRDCLFRPFSELLHPSDVAPAQEAFGRVMRGEWVPPLEMRLMTLAGGEIAVECMCAPIGAGGQPGEVWGIARDITQRRSLEQSALQAQKMEAVGRLAGVIAHDFNNLLTTINGNADLLHEALEPSSPLLGNVRGILGATERAAALTRELLTLSRQQNTVPQNTDLNGVVHRFVASLRGLPEGKIDLAVELDPALPGVFADPGQIERMLAILVANAREAMPTGGRLVLSTSHEQGPESAHQVRLTVTDSGLGMGDEVKAHLFEPFFTTKPVGKGTGLGLSTVYNIVKSAGGDIQAQSAPGQGTTFVLRFPPSKPGAADSQANPNPPEESKPGAETILLVEDDDDVRFLLLSILKTHGYRVLEAKDGEQALQVAEAHDGPIQMVLTDLQMPKLGGRKLVERLLTSHPGMKALFMSGFGREDFPEAESVELPVSFLEKPFMPKSLVRNIRKVLDG